MVPINELLVAWAYAADGSKDSAFLSGHQTIYNHPTDEKNSSVGINRLI
jgi:hypothetical protein